MSIKELFSSTVMAVYTGAKGLIDNGDHLIGENSKELLSDKDNSEKFLNAIDNLVEDNQKQSEDIELGNGNTITIEMR